jgi:hypothetical protein
MFDKLKWRWRLSCARGRMNSHAECGMGYTPGHQRAAAQVHSIETEGIRRGWMTDAQRSVQLEHKHGTS